LVFLTEYERAGGGQLVRYFYGGRSLSRANFFFWGKGIWSNEVWRVVHSDEVGARVDSVGRVLLYAEAEPRPLPPPVETRLRETLAKYGEVGGGELERVALSVLGLGPRDAYRLAGTAVEQYTRDAGLRVKRIELD